MHATCCLANQETDKTKHSKCFQYPAFIKPLCRHQCQSNHCQDHAFLYKIIETSLYQFSWGLKSDSLKQLNLIDKKEGDMKFKFLFLIWNHFE